MLNALRLVGRGTHALMFGGLVISGIACSVVDSTEPGQSGRTMLAFSTDTVLPPCGSGIQPSLLPYAIQEPLPDSRFSGTLACGGGPRPENGPQVIATMQIRADPNPPKPAPAPGLSVFLPPPATGNVVIQLPVPGASFGNITLEAVGGITPGDTTKPADVSEDFWKDLTSDMKLAFNASLSDLCDGVTMVPTQVCRSLLGPKLEETIRGARARVRSYIGARPGFRGTNWDQLVHAAAFYGCEITAMADTAFNPSWGEVQFLRIDLGDKLLRGEIATSIEDRPWEISRVFERVNKFVRWGYEKKSLVPRPSCAEIVDSAHGQGHFNDFPPSETPPWQNPPGGGGGGGGGGSCGSWLECGPAPTRGTITPRVARTTDR